MQLTFLGTGTSGGVPLVACNCEVCASTNQKDKRLRASVLLQYENTNIVIDAGPDFREQMLRTNTRHVDAILLTHGHRDHIAGLDDTRSLTYLSQRPMDVYADRICIKMMSEMYSYVFKPSGYPGLPEFNIHEIGIVPFHVNNIEFVPIQVLHNKLPVTGFRFRDFAYITDANQIAETEMKKLRGLKYLVLNALRQSPHVSHFSLSEALTLFQQCKPEKMLITHISHQMGLHNVVSNQLPQGVQLAYDGMIIDW